MRTLPGETGVGGSGQKPGNKPKTNKPRNPYGGKTIPLGETGTTTIQDSMNPPKKTTTTPPKSKTVSNSTTTAPPTAPTITTPPVRTQMRIDVTPNRNVGKPSGVKAAEADRVAALAALAAEQRRQDAALRDQYSQSLMAAQSSAADVYGGRAPAIFGQAVTGGRRQYVSGRSQQVQENVAQRAELQRAYAEAIRQAYAAAAAQRQQDAFNRAQLSMAASQMMGY